MMSESLSTPIAAGVEANPRPNPSVGVNTENDLYEVWKTSDEASRPQVESYLLPHLRRHAAKVCWMVLHSYQSHLIDEISQDALMELYRFEGRSAFSTWFHARALNRCYNERKKMKRRKEVSYGDYFTPSVPARATLETTVMVQSMVDKLDPSEQRLVELKINEGLTDEEIAGELQIPRQTVQYRWTCLRKKLRTMYNDRRTVK